MSPQATDSEGEEEDGGLFGSDSSEDEGRAPSNIKPPMENRLPMPEPPKTVAARGLDMAIFELEAVCSTSNGAAALRLGGLLAAAWLVVDAADGHENWHLHLQLLPHRLGDTCLTPETICQKVVASDIGLHAVSVGREPALIIQALAPMLEPHSTLMSILAHLVDLPVENECNRELGAMRPEKRRKVTREFDGMVPELQLTTEMEALLDDFCCERAALLQKPAAEQDTFREAAVAELTAKRAVVTGKLQNLLDCIALARPLTSRDRWLASLGAAPVGTAVPVGENALPWATKISKLWQTLPDSDRHIFRAAVYKDQVALCQQDQQAKQLQELVEEVDVFLRNLEPCSLCRDPHKPGCLPNSGR